MQGRAHRPDVGAGVDVGRQAARLLDVRAELMQRLEISETEARSIIIAALSGVGSMLLARLA